MAAAELGSRSKSPCYPWYPGDLRRDTGVRASSFYAVSVWREMLDAMHDGDPYGHFTAGGEPITAEQLARMIGEPVRKVVAAIAELELHGVFSRTPEGVIYSRRMVRDDDLRRKRAVGGIKGGNPALLKDKVKDNDKVNLPDNHTNNHTVNPASAVAVASALPDAEQKTDNKPPLVPPGEKPSKPKKPKRELSPMPDGWLPTDKHRQLAARLGLDCDVEAEHFRDHAEANDRRLKSWEAGFRLWLRMAKKFNGHKPPAGSTAATFDNKTERNHYADQRDAAAQRPKRDLEPIDGQTWQPRFKAAK